AFPAEFRAVSPRVPQRFRPGYRDVSPQIGRWPLRVPARPSLWPSAGACRPPPRRVIHFADGRTRRTGGSTTGRRSAADVRPGPGEADPEDDPALALHRRPVVVPVGVLAGDPAVVLNEEFHRIRQVNDFRLALHLDPLAEEAVVDDTERCPGSAPEAPGLDRGLARA